jgi:hypothetical protein
VLGEWKKSIWHKNEYARLLAANGKSTVGASAEQVSQKLKHRITDLDVNLGSAKQKAGAQAALKK